MGHLSQGHVVGVGLLGGVGFTMALFIANLSLDQALIDSAKPGIFPASAVSALAGIALLSGLPGHGKLSHMARRLRVV